MPSPVGGANFTGVVQSGSGTGPYQVLLTNQSGSTTVSANIPQIDSSQTVPPGTAVILVFLGGQYFFQPAVWLAPAS